MFEFQRDYIDPNLEQELVESARRDQRRRTQEYDEGREEAKDYTPNKINSQIQTYYQEVGWLKRWLLKHDWIEPPPRIKAFQDELSDRTKTD